MRETVFPESGGDPGKEGGEGRLLAGSPIYRYIVRPAVFLIEAGIFRERAVHLQDSLQLRRGSIGVEVIVDFFGGEFAEAQKIFEEMLLPSVEEFFGKTRNLHKVHMPHCGATLDLFPSSYSRSHQVENHCSSYHFDVLESQRIGD